MRRKVALFPTVHVFHTHTHATFLGGAVDLFYRYGFFSLSVRVVPRDDAGKWLVREPTADIFDKTSVVKSQVAGADTFAKQPFQVNNHHCP